MSSNTLTGPLDGEQEPARIPKQTDTCKMAALGSDRQKGHLIRRFLGGNKSVLRVLEMLEMTKEQSEDNFERKTTWATVAIDLEIATATKIPTARGHAMVKGMQVNRHKGQVLRQMWKQIAMLGEVEEMTELLTEQASDLMFVGLAKAEGFCNRSETSVRNEGCRIRDEVAARESIRKGQRL